MGQPLTDDPDVLLDQLAEELLADAVADLDTTPDQPVPAGAGQPDMGDNSRPDMGVPMTHPQPSDPGSNPAPAPNPAPPAPNPPAPAPSPPPVPQFVAPIPTAQAHQTPANGGQHGQPAPVTGTGGQNPDVYNYPENTALAQMTLEQQSEYWRHKARKHEDRVKQMGDYDQLRQKADEYERLVTESQTQHERAVAEARRQGHAEALAAAGGQLVDQWFRAAAVGRLPEQSVDALLAGLDRSRFMNAQGGVDTDRVYALVNSVAPQSVSAPAVVVTGTPGQPAVVAGVQQAQLVPAAAPQPAAPPRGPDFGQGNPGAAKLSGLARGREIARARFGNENQQPAT